MISLNWASHKIAIIYGTDKFYSSMYSPRVVNLDYVVIIFKFISI